MRLAASLLSLDRQRIPGTLGFEEPDEEAAVPGLAREPCAARVETALCCSHATGGAEVALVLVRA